MPSSRNGKTSSTHDRRPTRTSAFGAGSRISHDSSEYYSRAMQPDGVDLDVKARPESVVPEESQDRIFVHSSMQMPELPDRSVHLMVTSPPYNVGKDYDEDLSLGEYSDLLLGVLKETHRVLVDGRQSVRQHCQRWAQALHPAPRNDHRPGRKGWILHERRDHLGQGGPAQAHRPPGAAGCPLLTPRCETRTNTFSYFRSRLLVERNLKVVNRPLNAMSSWSSQRVFGSFHRSLPKEPTTPPLFG